jgi:divalent metal cation (Fe/Co/Zn/Cd) transporter
MTVTITGILTMLSALCLARMQYGHAGILIDPAFAAILATYMLVNAVILIKNNFRSLMDMPLVESDQLKILNVLSSHYDSYENLGNIYTRTCGNTRIIEIELHFKPNTSLETINLLAERLRAQFETLFADFDFRLLPVTAFVSSRPGD